MRIVRSLSSAIAGLFVLAWACAAQQAEFRVHVVDPQDKDVGNADVQLVSSQRSQTRTTGVSGRAVFGNLLHGKYNIRVSAYGFIVRQLQNYDITVPQNRPLQATLSFATLGCDFPYHVDYDNTEPRGAPVRGSVIGADSRKAIQGATLVLRPVNENKLKITIRSRKKGMFEVPNTAPGRYRLRVTDEFFNNLEIDLIVPILDAAVITVELDRSGHVHLCE